MKRNQGFTLMDVLISAAIVSLLSSVILFNVSEGKVKAEDAKMKTESAQVATAIEIYKTSNNGKTPIAHLTASGVPFTSNVTTGEMYDEVSPEYIEVMNKLVETGYLSAVPKSPDGSSYAYGESEDGMQAFFTAKLKKGGSSRNYCSAIPQETPQNPFNCQFVDLSTNQSCLSYLQENPNKICVDGPTANFCSIYNTNGEMTNFCGTCHTDQPTAPTEYPTFTFSLCGTYGGSTMQPLSMYYPATVCDVGVQDLDTMCNGSSDEDYCICI